MERDRRNEGKPRSRRIYIHEVSFESLARRSQRAAELVFSSLAQATVVKILHHHFTQAIEFGLLDASKARQARRRLNDRYGQSLTLALRQVGYQALERGRHDFFPLITQDERIVACCLEAGYFTFATDYPAAQRMYAEKGSMREERAAIRDGRGPDDLTWINGRRLALLDPTLPTGPGAAANYFRGPAHGEPLRTNDLARVKRQAVSQVLSESETIIRGDEPWDSPEEVNMLHQVLTAFRWALSRSIFTLAPDETPVRFVAGPVSAPHETPLACERGSAHI